MKMLIFATAILIMCLANPVLSDLADPPAWIGGATSARHFTFVRRSYTEDTSEPFGKGYRATMQVDALAEPLGAFDYTLRVENLYAEGYVKVVWLQYVLEHREHGYGIWWGSDMGAWKGGLEKTEDLGANFSRFTWSWTIDPQPNKEWFRWTTAGECRLHEVGVATYCVPVPASFTLAVLGTGTTLVRLRRKRLLGTKV